MYWPNPVVVQSKA